MSRFSPQVKPTSAPSGLAQALQSGMAGFQRERDRMEGQQDRARKRTIETDTLASQGLMPNLPETPETFGSAFTRALSGAPEPQPQAVVPGGFVVEQGDFEKVDPRTGQPSRVMRLPSGGTYDPSVMEGRTAGMTLAKGLAGNQVKAGARNDLRGEVGADVVALGGTMAGAGLEPVAQSWLRKQPSTLKVLGANAGNPAGVVDPENGTFTPLKGSNAVPKDHGLRLGDPGYAEAMAEVAAARQSVSQGGMTVGERNKVVQIEDLQNLINRAQDAQIGPDGKMVESGRVGGVIPVPNWVRLQFDMGGRPSRNLQLLISDLTSQVGNLRSGGAITPQEFERLEGFLPTMNERPEVIADKLQSFETTLADMLANRQRRSATPQRRESDAPADDLVGAFESTYGRKP